MRNGYIICAITYNEAHLVAAAEGLPPASITTTDWSYFPQIKKLKPMEGATYFLLRIPGNSRGLYRALEEMMDVAGVYRESCDYTGLKNHRRLLDAVGKIQRGTTDRAVVGLLAFARAHPRARVGVLRMGGGIVLARVSHVP